MAIETNKYDIIYGRLLHLNFTPTHAKGLAKVLYDVTEQYGFPSWVEVNSKSMTGTFSSLPDRVDLGSDINEQLVVELYSK